MSKLNKTEIDSNVDLTFIPTLAIADHRTFLKEMSDSYQTKKHRILTAVGGSSYTADFENYETIVLNAAATNSITVTNLVVGQMAYLKLANDHHAISFTNVQFSSFDNLKIGLITNKVYVFFNINNVIKGLYLGETTSSSTSLNLSGLIRSNSEFTITVNKASFSNAPIELTNSIFNSLIDSATIPCFIKSKYNSITDVTTCELSATYIQESVSWVNQMQWIGHSVGGSGFTWRTVYAKMPLKMELLSLNNTVIKFVKIGAIITYIIIGDALSVGTSTESIPFEYRPSFLHYDDIDLNLYAGGAFHRVNIKINSSNGFVTITNPDAINFRTVFSFPSPPLY